jgi:hypothetical protein
MLMIVTPVRENPSRVPQRPDLPHLPGVLRRGQPHILKSCSWHAVIPGYTGWVKTAISLPDDTYDEATQRARELGISRSEFFARAARRYLDELAARSLTEQVDEALQVAGADDSGAVATAAGRRHLASQDDW